MRKINTNELVEETWSSPKGKFAGAGKEGSEACVRKPQATDPSERHPFEGEIARLRPGKAHPACHHCLGGYSRLIRMKKQEPGFFPSRKRLVVYQDESTT